VESGPDQEGGIPVPADLAGTVRYIFDGERVTLMEGDVRGGGHPPGPGGGPKAFDFTATEGPQKGETARGIYRVEGDAPTMCSGDVRLSEFTGATEAALVELTRL
jgi:uncharacterized protein (TIGR03067 family)